MSFTLNNITYTILSGNTTVSVTSHTLSVPTSVTLTSTVTNSSTTYTLVNINFNAFNKTLSANIPYDPSGLNLTGINIPNSVTVLYGAAFQSCTQLSTVTFDASSTLVSIGDAVFQGCFNLTGILIPNSVTSIGFGGFTECSSITSIIIPPNVSFTGSNHLLRCTNLTSITFQNNLTSITENMFQGCTRLPSITIPITVTSINQAGFFACTALTNVSFLNTTNLKSIGYIAFGTNISLQSITIPDSVTSFGVNADTSGNLNAYTFSTCSNLSSINLSTSLTAIPRYTFSGCSKLTSIMIPGTVTNIGDYAFNNCSLLTSVTFLGKLIPTISTTGNFGNAPTDTAYCRYDVDTDASSYKALLYNASTNPTGFFTTVSTTPCFKSDSKILTDKGYVPIQDLKKGDLVKTLKNGFVPVNMIGKKEIYNPASKDRVPDQLYTCASPQYPEVFEPLVITGLHAILVDDFKQGQREYTLELFGDIYVTDNKYRLPACADDRTTVYEVAGCHTIYHLVLDNSNDDFNYGIYANGLLVETISERSFKHHFTCN